MVGPFPNEFLAKRNTQAGELFAGDPFTSVRALADVDIW
jgi:hypothetical protein